MNGILEKDKERQLLIIKVLLSDHKIWDRQEICKLVRCSKKTLAREMKSLENSLPDKWQLINTNEGILLEKPFDENFIHLFSAFFSETYLFRLCYDIYDEKEISLAVWCQENFVSPATIYRKLTPVHRYLKSIHLQLENKPLHLIGKESQIRFLYYDLFFNAYPAQDLFFIDINWEIIDGFIEDIMRKLDIYFSPAAKIQYAAWVGLSLTRIKRGYPIDSRGTRTTRTWKVYNERNDLAEAFQILSDATHIEISESESIFILSCIFFCSKSYNSEKSRTARIETSKEANPVTYRLVEAIFNILPKIGWDEDDLMVSLIDTFSMFHAVESPLFLAQERFLIKEEHVLSPDLEQQIATIFQTFAQEPVYAYLRENHDVLMYRIGISIQTAMERTARPAVLTAKIFSQNGFLWEDLVKKTIRSRYSAQQLIIVGSGHPQADFIITDLPLPHNTIPQLVWNTNPTLRDWQMLDAYLNEKTQQKEELL
ncbi:helix-turn-helix domain-containing protein [Listeria rustica]|uniref:Helix-turn-helix domain-containing protein n=1 Tax=Listeria rustica TaxID=2713503 RepID=A0A7W1T5M7_9LIST|nr:helix-turn-helix domain-containing protein [Listeria rustica]MBA3925961.1 helix-turn-helix domain-containing protein [Listeria rustica]